MIQKIKTWHFARLNAKRYPQSEFQKHLNDKRYNELKRKLPKASKAKFNQDERSESLVSWACGYALYFAVIVLIVYVGG